MKKYLVYVTRTKVNEFELEAENKNDAENIVRDILNKSTLLNCKIINQVPTEITIRAEKYKIKKERIKNCIINMR